MTGLPNRRRATLDALVKMGARCCCYTASEAHWLSGTCDCKYGAEGFADPRYVSEQTGCPELRELHALLSAMTDDEWAGLAWRAWQGPKP